MLKDLEQLGLATNDAKVYEALIELGTAGGGEISRKTGFHRNIVYESIDRLLSRRLVTKVYRQKIALFQIADPKKLLYEVKQKEQIAEKLIKEIEQKANVTSTVTVFDGEEGFRTFWRQHIERMQLGDEYFVLGSLGDLWGKLLEPILPWVMKQLKKKNISGKVVAYAINNKDNIFLKSGLKYEARLMPRDYQTPANVLIWGDFISLQTGVPPYSVIDIYNPALAKAYKETFNALWESAGKYPEESSK